MASGETVVDGAQRGAGAWPAGQRIGWLLRSHRQAQGRTLSDLAARAREVGMSVSAPTLSRVENGHLVKEEHLEVHDRVLGLGGQVEAVSVILRRMVGPPPWRPPSGRLLDLAAHTTVVEHLREAVDAGRATGPQWSSFALAHGEGRAFGVTATEMHELVEVLVSEHSRSVGLAYVHRNDALSRLAGGAYAEVVADRVRDFAAVPDAQVLIDAVSCLSETASPAVVPWLVELLGSPNPVARRAGSLALAHVASRRAEHEIDWESCTPAIRRALGAEVEEGLDHDIAGLVGALPLVVRRACAGVTRGEPSAAASPWAPGELKALTLRLGAAVCARVGVASDEDLARALHESFSEDVLTSGLAGMLLMASPFAVALPEVLLEAAIAEPQPRRAAALMVVCRRTQSCDLAFDVAGLASREALRESALLLAGQCAQPVPDDVLTDALSGDRWVARAALSALGMAADPRLDGVARSHPDQAGAVRWWRQEGPRVVA